MSGVYTDNQPDFTFLQPGETKTWSQFWYPIQGIGLGDKSAARRLLEAVIERAPSRALVKDLLVEL